MAVKQLSVFLDNRPAQLLKLSDALRQNGIDIRALSLSETKDFGIARLIVNKPEQAVEVLTQRHFIAKITPVLAVKLDDEAGGLYKILEILAENGINLEYCYAFVLRKLGSACSVLRLDDTEKAETLFRQKGLELLEKVDSAE